MLSLIQFLRRMRFLDLGRDHDGLLAKQGRKSTRPVLQFELLEDRTLLSGNLIAAIASNSVVGSIPSDLSVYRLDATTGNTTATLVQHANFYLNNLAAEPDGSVVLAGGLNVNGGGGQYGIYTLPATGGSPTLFSDIRATHVAVMPDSTLIAAFASNSIIGSVPSDLTVYHIDASGNATPLLQDANFYLFSLAVEADGTVILAGGLNVNGGGGQYGIYTLPATGGSPTLFSTIPANAVAVTANNTLVAAVASNSIMSSIPSDLTIDRIDSAGNASTILQDANFFLESMAAEPDGSVALAGAYKGFTHFGVYTIPAAGGNPTKVSSLLATNLSAPPAVLPSAPQVSDVTDQYATGGSAGARDFGTYLSGVALQDTFTATVEHSEVVTELDYQFGNSGIQGTATRVAGGDQWSFTVDTGKLSPDMNSPDIDKLILTPHYKDVSGQDQTANPYTATVDVTDKVDLSLQGSTSNDANNMTDVDNLRFLREVSLNGETFSGQLADPQANKLPSIYMTMLASIQIGNQTVDIPTSNSDGTLSFPFDPSQLPAGNSPVTAADFQGTSGITPILVEDPPELFAIDLPAWMGTPKSEAFGNAPSGLFQGTSQAYVLNLAIPPLLTQTLPNISTFGLFDDLTNSYSVGLDLTVYAKLTFNDGDAVVQAQDAHADVTILGNNLVSWQLNTPSDFQSSSVSIAPKTLAYVNSLTLKATHDFGSFDLFQESFGDTPPWKTSVVFASVAGPAAQLEASLALTGNLALEAQDLSADMTLTFNNTSNGLTLDPASFLHLGADIVGTGNLTATGTITLNTFLGSVDLVKLVGTADGVMFLDGDLFFYPNGNDPLKGSNLTMQLGYQLGYNLSFLPEPFTFNFQGKTPQILSQKFYIFGAGSADDQPPGAEVDVKPQVGLEYESKSPVAPLITDPLGRRLGTDPATGQFVNEIDPLATDTGPGSEPRILTIPFGDVVLGTYVFSGVGTGSGPYQLELLVQGANDPTDILLDQTLSSGIAVPGQEVPAIAALDLFAAIAVQKSIITWPDPADITYGTALSSTQLDATANVPGTFVYAPAAGTVLNAGEGQTLSVTFTPDDTTRYTTATGTVTINVKQATPTVTVIDNGGPFNGQPYLAGATATGVADAMVQGSFALAYTDSQNNSLTSPPSIVGTYNVVATFTSADPNYTNGVSVPVAFSISAGPAGAISSDTPVFAWLPVAGAKHYALKITSGKTVVLNPTTITTTTYTVPSKHALTPGQTYTWSVTALDSKGKAISHGSSFTFQILPLGAPALVGPSGTVVTDRPTFTWTPVTDAGHTAANHFTLTVTNTATKHSISITFLKGTSYTLTAAEAISPGASYTWSITAVSTNGKATAVSQSGAFTIAPLTAPTGLVFASANDTFSWQAVTDAGHYALKVLDSVTKKTIINITDVVGTSYHLSAKQAKLLKHGRSYTWYVSAVSSNGQVSVRSTGATFTM